jgi:putative selenate reductase
VAIYTGPVTYPLIHAIREGGETRLNRVGMATINQSYQVVNIVDFCNECGNCETFCPTAGAPYRDKPKVHLSRESFEAYGMGVHFSSKDRMESVLNRMEGVLYTQEEGIIFEDPEVRVIFNEDTLEVIELAWKKDAKEKDVGPVSELAVLFRLLRSNLDYPLYTKKRAFT